MSTQHIAANLLGWVSVPSPSSINIPKAERVRYVVQLGDKLDGDVFEFDEEMHVFKLPRDYGYMSLQLGHRFTEIDRVAPVHRKGFTDTDEYEVVRKLGWGAEGSVWLARRHTKDGIPRPRFAAIKIMTSYHSQLAVKADHPSAQSEMRALQRLNQSGSHPENAYCTTMQDLFPCFGPKEKPLEPHICLVFEPYSINMFQYVNELRRGSAEDFPLVGLKNIIKQVVMALTYVHHSGMIHTDVKLDNLFIDTGEHDDEIDTLLLTDPSRTYPPRHEPRISPDPIITVESQPLPLFGNPDIHNLPIKLGDFGTAYFCGQDHQSAMPDGIRAPEIFLGCHWDNPVDIWSVGGVLWDLIFFRAYRKIFEVSCSLPEGMSPTHAHLARIEELLGTIPPSFIEKCPERSSFFNDDGRLLHPLPGDAKIFGSLAEQLFFSPLKGKCTPDELLDTPRFMCRCLEIDPAERPTAEELLKDPWLEEVV